MFEKSDKQIIEKFYNLKSGMDVSDMLEIDFKSLRYFTYGKQNKYVNFQISKKNGGVRQISAPIKELKYVQKKLAYVLKNIYKPKKAAHGFLNGRDIKTNSINHIKQRNILNIDLKDFFSQIHFGRIRGLLMSKPYSIGEEASTYIAQLACEKGKLPQGAPSSPIITNMICSSLDSQLTMLAKKYNCIYSRYADDITFSTYNLKFDNNIVSVSETEKKISLGKELKKIFQQNGFEINEKKIFLNAYISRQEVTGLVVNKKLNLKREFIKNIRAILNNCQEKSIYESAKLYIEKGFCKNKFIIKNKENKEITEKWFKQVLKGKINYISFVRGENDKIFLKYAEQCNKIFKEEVFNIRKQKELNELLENVVIIENRDGNRQGSGFLLKNYGIVTSFHVTEDNDFYDVYKLEFYKREIYAIISNEINLISSDNVIDYAIYKDKNNGRFLNIGDSNSLNIGDKVTIVGYPNFQKGDSYNIQERKISGKKTFMECILYTVDGIICHGASGGAVFDKHNNVVGIIKAGIENMESEQLTVNQGFIPIHFAIQNIKL